MTNKLIISITTEQEAMQQFKAGFIEAVNTGKPQDTHIYFLSPAALFQKITPKRWELIAKLQESGVVSIRELARLLKRDIRRVHDDVVTLEEQSIIERTEAGIRIPYDEIHTDFTLKAKAA